MYGDWMSEEEKKAIETVENFIKYYKKNEQTGNRANLDVLREETQAIEFILNKYDMQQEQLNSLKEIEQLHQEENGKLRVELEQEKEKNKELEKSDRSKEQSSMSYYNKLRDLKNKIIAKLEELEYGDGYFTFLEERDLELTIKILKQLLEEK